MVEVVVHGGRMEDNRGRVGMIYLLKVSLATGGTDLEFNVEMLTLESSAQKLA